MSTLQKAAQEQLRQFIEQIERLEEEKRALAADIRDKLVEAKGVGFDTKIMKKLLAKRKLSKTERDEQESMLDVYMHALGMLSDTPLGQAAIEREGLNGNRLRDLDTPRTASAGSHSASI